MTTEYITKLYYRRIIHYTTVSLCLYELNAHFYVADLKTEQGHQEILSRCAYDFYHFHDGKDVDWPQTFEVYLTDDKAAPVLCTGEVFIAYNPSFMPVPAKPI